MHKRLSRVCVNERTRKKYVEIFNRMKYLADKNLRKLIQPQLLRQSLKFWIPENIHKNLYNYRKHSFMRNKRLITYLRMQ